jgi:hypothetical protein
MTRPNLLERTVSRPPQAAVCSALLQMQARRRQPPPGMPSSAPASGRCRAAREEDDAMHMLDEMLHRHLLSPQQHAEIRAWVRSARTPEGILQMPPALWRSLELASVLIGFGQEPGDA